MAEKDKLQNALKHEIKDLTLKVEKVKESNNIEEKIFKKLKKENEIVMKRFEENQQKVVANTVEEAIVKSMNKGKDNLNHQNSGDKVEVVQNKDKPKSKLKKPTKEEKENEVIAEFEEDIQNVHIMRTNCGLDLSEIKCKKCNFETHSEGTLRKHKRTVHNLKESNLNTIVRFRADMNTILYV